MQFYASPTSPGPALPTASRGGRLPHKIARNRIAKTVRQQVAARAPKSAPSCPKGSQNGAKIPQMPSQGRLGHDFLPNWSTFRNMRRRVRIECPDPPEVPLKDTFSTQRVSKGPLGKLLAKRSPEMTKSCATGATRVPQGPPKWHLKSQKITPKSHSGTHGRQGLDSRALGGTPRAKMTSKRDPERHLNTQA